jgi:hypothetical protein
MAEKTLRQVDVLRHELKALRFILDAYYSGKLAGEALPPRDDFLSQQSVAIYDAIVHSKARAEAEERIRALDLDDVDIDSFLALSGGHYYTYPALVRQRARALRAGQLTIEAA